MARHAQAERAAIRRSHRVVRPAALLAIAWLAGCASVQQTTGGWADRAKSVTAEERVRYAASRHVRVFREPDVSSEVVHQLLLHETVLAYQVENGFTYIRVEQTGMPGWVLEQDLVERIAVERKPAVDATPAAPRPAAASSGPGSAGSAPEASPEPEPESGGAAGVEPAPEAAVGDAEGADSEPAPDAGEAPTPPPEKSVFDPY